MAAPIKRISDLQLSGGGADLNPHLTALATGQFIIQWESVPNAGNFITHQLQVLGADGGMRSGGGGGAAASNETALSGYGLTNGNAALVWTDTATATNDADIRADVENPNGGGGSASFLVNVNDTNGNQVRPEVAELNTGNLAFTWIDAGTNQIKAAVATPFGGLFAPNITVSTTASSQGAGGFDLGLTPLANGNFAVSWRDDNFQDHFRILSPFGSLLTNDITVASAASAGAGDIIQLADGTIEVVYLSNNLIRGHAYDASGDSLGAEFAISATNGDLPAATALQDGRFMVVYQGSGDIFGRVMNRDGTPSSDEFRVNTDPTGTQAHVTIDTLADGQVAIAWEDNRTGSGDVYYTIFDPRQSAVTLTGTNRADSFVGTDFNDTLTGGFSDDFLKGGGGSDTFVFKSSSDGPDTLADFQHGQDHILLGSNFVSEGGGPHSLSSAVHFDYGSAATTSSPTVL